MERPAHMLVKAPIIPIQDLLFLEFGFYINTYDPDGQKCHRTNLSHTNSLLALSMYKDSDWVEQ